MNSNTLGWAASEDRSQTLNNLITRQSEAVAAAAKAQAELDLAASTATAPQNLKLITARRDITAQRLADLRAELAAMHGAS